MAFTIPLIIGAVSLAELSRIDHQIDQDWSMAFPNGPGRSDSSIFDQIARVEQLVNYYVGKSAARPSTYGMDKNDLYRASKASQLLMNLEVVRDIRLRRESEAAGGPRQVEAGPSSGLFSPPAPQEYYAGRKRGPRSASSTYGSDTGTLYAAGG